MFAQATQPAARTSQNRPAPAIKNDIATASEEEQRPWQSPRLFFGALALLLAIPVTILSQIVWANGAESMIHWTLAVGFILFAVAVFDFKMNRTVTWIGSLGMAALSAIFIIQGISEAVSSSALHTFAFDMLGQGIETAAMYGFFIWCFAMLFTVSTGKAKVFGLIVMTAIVAVEVFGYAASFSGNEAPEILKLVSLFACVWLLVEGMKKVAAQELGGRIPD